ncbi:MAG: HutD family protein [Steroidobacteraceae bacterium]
MPLLPAGRYRRMPWKNGGGETFEIAVQPAGASLEDMDWRLSMAVVASDGPFSSFPGIDRTLSIVDGAGLLLDTGAESGPVTLTAHTAPLHFAADVPTSATLIAGTVTDLNVMTRRASYQHRVRRIAVAGRYEMASTARELAVFCASGSVMCEAGDEAAALQPRDCALFTAAPGGLVLAAAQGALVLIAELFPVRPI